MDYQRLYNELIAFRKDNPPSGYTENHHILMKSMGGTDDKENLVRLTGREHWIAHLYLYKIHRNSQTAHACHMMAMKSEERGIPQVRNSRMYEAIRKECARLTGIATSKLVGARNSQFGTRWICNTELKESKKILKDEEIPEGWVAGRISWAKTKIKRIRLLKGFHITDGKTIKKITYEDQLPIKENWVITKDVFTSERKQNMSLSKQGARHNNIGKRWICNVLERKNKYICLDASVPDGWELGREKWKSNKSPRLF